MRTCLTGTLLFAVLLCGCISIEVSHKQHADGSADIVHSTDLSLLESAYGSNKSTYGPAIAEAFNKLCDQYEESIECKRKGGVVTLTKRYTTADSFYTFEVRDELFVKKYRLTIDELPDFNRYKKKSSSIFGDEYDYGSPYSPSTYGSSYGSSYGGYSDYLGTANEKLKLSSAKAKSTGALLKQIGMEYTYTVQMPGRITDAPGALEFNDTSATFDVVQQLQERKPIVVVSEEINWIGAGIVGVIALVAVLTVAIAVMLMLKPKQVS